MYGNLFQTEFLRGKPARVSDYNYTLFIEHDGLSPAELLNRSCHLVYSLLWDFAGVSSVWNDAEGQSHFDFHTYLIPLKVHNLGSAYCTSAKASITASARSGDLAPRFRASSFDSMTIRPWQLWL
jgi:hypothetical protein